MRSVGDAVALVAADSEELAEAAIERIVVDYEPLPGVFTIEAALAPNAPLVNGDDNLFQHTTVRKGDIDEGFAQADVIVEQTYRTQSMDHVPMEPEAGLAYVDNLGVLNIITATQYPFRDRRQIAPNVGLPMNRVRVIQAPVGGGFGRKDDITTEIHAGLLALKTGRPVRLVYTREESLFALTKRHPFTIHYKSGARANGQLTAVEASIYGDSGPYVSLGMYVIKKAGIHATGPYFVPNVKVDTYTVTTNNLTGGAMRGFGVLQVAVAHESQMDMLARGLGMSPLKFRMINCLKPGSDDGDRAGGERGHRHRRHVAAHPGIHGREQTGVVHAMKKRGLGVGSMFYGIGYGFNRPDIGAAHVEVAEDGTATLYTGVCDLGQGIQTLLAQIVGTELGMPMSDIRVVNADTGEHAGLGPDVRQPRDVRAGAGRPARQPRRESAPGRDGRADARRRGPRSRGDPQARSTRARLRTCACQSCASWTKCTSRASAASAGAGRTSRRRTSIR